MRIYRYEYLDGAALHKRFPQFVNRPDLSAILDPEGGLVDAALGNAVHIQLARARGAHIQDNVKVLELRPTDDGGCQVGTGETRWGPFYCCGYLSMLRLKLIHINQSPRCHVYVK